ncbi:hypothetical protein [Saccharothrix coeruleofusca]|uniref:Uncharacterized protein n=1 Tax=Saccharothrix coeruleofusca TaxID=33919 RepID=A0A918ARC7_9PSEU|nr:hypothetical protein [Saccharothrix coeruleofusca]MBP2335815.1 hypothetical protein [Saccharothrix coeruleofusca]GGP75026.1 hypothetical protein GCM10010185_55660 [Saccharothrix coeruleofusca]
MAKVQSDPQRVEQDARTRFANLDEPPPAVRDADNRLVQLTPNARFLEIRRRARLIAVSDGLAEAVALLLGGDGARVSVDHVRVDPAESRDEQVMAVRGTIRGVDAVVPLRPGALHLHAYPATDDIELTGEPLLSVELSPDVRQSDGWVPAAAIVAALREHFG